MNRADAVNLMYDYYFPKGYNSKMPDEMIIFLGKYDVDGLVAYAVDQAIDAYEAEIKKQLGVMGFLLEEK